MPVWTSARDAPRLCIAMKLLGMGLIILGCSLLERCLFPEFCGHPFAESTSAVERVPERATRAAAPVDFEALAGV